MNNEASPNDWPPALRTTQGLTRADALAQRYHCRPSALFGVSDPYLAYCVDEACAIAATQEQAKPKGALTDGVKLKGTVQVIERPPDAPYFKDEYPSLMALVAADAKN